MARSVSYFQETNQQPRRLNDGYSMKRIMIFMAVALFTMGTANAQDKQQRPAAERAKKQTERMTKELGLNADQAAKVDATNAKYAEKMDAMRADRKEKMAETKGKGAELNDARMAEMKDVLTPEQYAKMEKNREAMQERHKEKRQEMRGTKKEGSK